MTYVKLSTFSHAASDVIVRMFLKCGIAEVHKCGSYRHKAVEVSAELKLKVLGLGLRLATGATNPTLAMHDYDILVEYSALTSAV